jgi:hypothetical protein
MRYHTLLLSSRFKYMISFTFFTAHNLQELQPRNLRRDLPTTWMVLLGRTRTINLCMMRLTRKLGRTTSWLTTGMIFKTKEPGQVMSNISRLSLGNEIYNSWPGLQDETGRISTPLDEDLFMQDSSPHQNGETDGSNAIGFQHIASGFASQQGDNFLLGSDESLGGQAGASAQIYSEPGVASDNICYGMVRFLLALFCQTPNFTTTHSVIIANVSA